MSDRFDPSAGLGAARGPVRTPAEDFNDSALTGASRLPGVLISLVCVVIVCALATWPRWHPAVATVQLAPGTDAAAVNGAADGTRSDATSPNTGTTAAAAAPSGASGASALAPVAGSGAAPNGAMQTSTASPTTPNTAQPNAPTGKREAARRPTLVRVPVSDDVPATWQALSPAQQDALQPFAELWPHLPDLQKRKWVAIASVYPRMSPEAQQRLHARMLRWTQMSVEQRKLARENYEMSRVLPPSARQQAWRAYEALPPAQRAKFAAADRRRQPLVVSAPPSEPHRTARHTARATPRGVAASGATAQGTAANATQRANGQEGAASAIGASAAEHSPAAPSTAQTPPESEPSVGQH